MLSLRGNDLKPYLRTSPSNIKSLKDLRIFGRTHESLRQRLSFVKQGFELLSCNNAEEQLVKQSEIKPSDWKYKINEYNFRNDWNFDDTRKKIGFFGCSFTFGEGISDDDLFVNIVSNHFSLNSFNLGVGGAGLERVARTWASANKVIKFDYAILTLPAWSRQMHLTSQGEIINIIPQWPHKDYEKIYGVFNSLDEDFYVNHAITYVNWIVDVAEKNNIKILLSSWDYPLNELCEQMYPELTIEPFRNLDDKCARDKMHPGPKSQRAYAETIIRAINDRAWF